MALWFNRGKAGGRSGAPTKDVAEAAKKKKPSADALAQPACGPSPNIEGNLEVYNIRIQHSFDKRASLPPISVWSRVIDQTSFRQATLRVCVKRRGLFFDRVLNSGFYVCILNRQGYLVIYTETPGSGYALNLRKTSKILFEFVPSAPAAAIAMATPVTSANVERVCKFTAKWRFGSVFITIPAANSADWCRATINALNRGPLLALPAIEMPPPCPSGQLRPSSADPQRNLPKLQPIEEAIAEGAEEQLSSDTKSLEDGTQESHDAVVVDEDLSPVDQQIRCNDDADDDDCTNADDAKTDEATDVLLPCSDTELVHEAVEATDEAFVLQPAEEDMLTVSISDSDMSTDSDAKEKQVNAEDGQEQWEQLRQKDGSAPTPLKRRVTFSDLREIIQINNRDEQADEKQTEEEAQKQGKSTEEEAAEVGCCPLVMHMFGNPFAAAVAAGNKEDDKAGGKEHIAGPALDLMRIVGQNATDEGADDNDKSSDGNYDDNNGAKAEEDRGGSSNLPQPPMRFPSQAERFARTRELFEPSTGDADSK